MPTTCAIETCQRKSAGLCDCCHKNVCSVYFNEHVNSINSQVHILVDELNADNDQLSKINMNDIIGSCRQKLDKWRDECNIIIDRFYEEKCQEAEQRCVDRFNKGKTEIEQMKSKATELIKEQEAIHEDQ
ncbi:unnamed protein product, partial [Rotaria sp. Silwood2]